MITANLEVTATTKPIKFGRTIIQWDRQEIIHQYNEGQHEIERMTKARYDSQVLAHKPEMRKISGIKNIVFPEYETYPACWEGEDCEGNKKPEEPEP